MANENEIDLTGAKILLVDDQHENLEVLAGVLQPEGYDIQVGLDGMSALDLAGRFVPDLILLDVMMPEIDGFETCRRLKADPATQDIPVIFLTDRVELSDVVEGFQAGGVDYITKPFQEEELKVRVSTQLRLRRAMKTLVAQKEALEAEIAQRKALTQERDHLAGRLSLISDEEARRWGIEGFVGQSQTLKQILQSIARLQQVSTISVLITGESGTGKELIARAIHFGSNRSDGPFVPVNCSAVPGDLADSLFFGHGRGAFTGADRDRAGYFELADGGTLFLDEIGDMPLDLQAKLLRVLEDGKVLPVGAGTEKEVDARVLSATNLDLEAAVEDGEFRQDLYHRLAGFPVWLPPLRERTEDIPLLARHFLDLFEGETGLGARLSEGAIDALKAHPFPGNIRELKNVIERAALESEEGVIEPAHLYFLQRNRPARDEPSDIAPDEAKAVREALGRTGGNVMAAARLLEMHRSRFYRLMEWYGLRPGQ